jgi:flagella basal body P-ring formation protein FlgA
MRYVAFTLVFLLSGLSAHAAGVLINTDCLYLDDIYGAGYPHTSVQCGIKAGEKRVILSQSIATALKRAGLDFSPAPPAVTVARKGGAVSEEAVKNEIYRRYRAQYPDYEISVEYVRFGREIFTNDPSGYKIQTDTNRFGSAGGTLLTDDGRFSFTYMVKVFANVGIASERINAGEEIASKTVYEYMDITGLRTPPLKDISGQIAKKVIQKGKILTADLAESKPDRIKGEPIRLIYESGDLKIEINAVADGNAVEGKTFPVLNPMTGKSVMARYIGNGTAKVY